MKRNAVNLSFYGIGAHIESDADDIIDAVTHDFSYFVSSAGKSDLKIKHRYCDPDYESLPVMTSSIATPRNITFKDKDLTYIDYFGRALNLYNKQDNSCIIFTKDKDLAHEIIYLSILSRVSEKLERKRINRIHALGVEYGGKGALIMLPSGGGKTTLALSILESPDKDFRLLSEDSPLITNKGTLLPFPLRIGTNSYSIPAHIDAGFIRHIKRMEYGPKTTIDIGFFADRVCNSEVPVSLVLLGVRSTGDASIISPVSKLAVVKHCLMNSVVGVGLYQGMEFIMQKSFFEFFGSTGIILSRMHNNLKLISRSKIFTFIIGRDTKKNYAVLHQFLKNYYNSNA